jgi:hypothetical protein
LQASAERSQQVNASGLRGGTAAKPLAVNRNVASGLLTADPIAQHMLESTDIQRLEKLATLTELAPERG